MTNNTIRVGAVRIVSSDAVRPYYRLSIDISSIREALVGRDAATPSNVGLLAALDEIADHYHVSFWSKELRAKATSSAAAGDQAMRLIQCANAMRDYAMTVVGKGVAHA